MNESIKGLNLFLPNLVIQFRRCYDLTCKSVDLLLEIDLVEADDLLMLVKMMREELPCHFHAENLDLLTD